MFNEYLKAELTQKAVKYGQKLTGNDSYRHPSVEPLSSVIYSQLEYNFHPEAFKNITAKKEFEKRFDKFHTNFNPDLKIKELQSSNSSDALAMNIFGHPLITKWKGIRDLLKVDHKAPLDISFGVHPGVKWMGKEDSTEVDIVINNIFCECKLTEGDFTHKNKEHVERYDLFAEVFHSDMLIQDDKYYYNYQLIRNILAAAENNYRFILFCDTRRPDLAKSFYQTIRCIKDNYLSLRMNCEIIYWQEIPLYAGKDLTEFLKDKYGIGQ